LQTVLLSHLIVTNSSVKLSSRCWKARSSTVVDRRTRARGRRRCSHEQPGGRHCVPAVRDVPEVVSPGDALRGTVPEERAVDGRSEIKNGGAGRTCGLMWPRSRTR